MLLPQPASPAPKEEGQSAGRTGNLTRFQQPSSMCSTAFQELAHSSLLNVGHTAQLYLWTHSTTVASRCGPHNAIRGVVVVVDKLRQKWHPLLTTTFSKACKTTVCQTTISQQLAASDLCVYCTMSICTQTSPVAPLMTTTECWLS